MFAHLLFAAEEQSLPNQSEEVVNSQIEDEQSEDGNFLNPKDPLLALWKGQYDLLKSTKEKVQEMANNFNVLVHDLESTINPFEEDLRRLQVFSQNFKNWPNPMEAVHRRVTAIIVQLTSMLEPLLQARAEAYVIQNNINSMAENLPDNINDARLSDDMKKYAHDVIELKFLCAAVIMQYDSALAPSKSLISELEKSQQEIMSKLPSLWKNYYLQDIVPYLSPESWAYFSQLLHFAYQGLILRFPVEFPFNTEQWITSSLRFIMVLSLFFIITYILRGNWVKKDSPKPIKDIFLYSAFWICFGFAFLAASLSEIGEFYRAFLAIGSLFLIIGMASIAWNFRILQYPILEEKKSPIKKLMPLTFFAYLLLYTPFIAPVVLLLWVVFLIFALFIRKYSQNENFEHLHLEPTILECDGIILWICLFLAIIGFHIYSMGLYIIFVSLSLAIQLSVSGMSFVANLNTAIPKRGVKAVLSSLLLALSAPLVLVVSVLGMLLWIGSLPGGIYLLKEYVLSGVNVGTTQFNILQLLLVISLFYLTRTAVSMGSTFVENLPKRGLQIDSTLVQPLQTAFSYLVWAVFILFALRAVGVELSNLAMVAGGLSVGIGFGMQNIINNFFSGLILIFSRTLQAGDIVEVGGVIGKVRKISVRATMVETYDNAVIYVPNAEFVSNRLINWTRNSRTMRKSVQVGVAYGSDTEKVMQVLLNIAKSHENVLQYPIPSVIFDNFGESTLDFNLRFWVKDYDISTSTASDIRMKIEQQFKLEGIEVAFPQVDVHIKSDSVLSSKSLD